MPRGGGRAPKKNYKGRSRHFTDEETLNQQLEKEEREKQWRKQRGETDETETTGAEGGTEGAIKEEDGSSSEESSSEDEDKGKKGVSHLIEIENPNRAVKKNQKLNALDNSAKGPQLSRREREELEKQQAKDHYKKMHLEGKTEEARNDMARLALIRKQREEAAKKREEEKERLEKEKAPKKS